MKLDLRLIIPGPTRILRGLEPATRYTIADDAVEYFDRLEALIRAS